MSAPGMVFAPGVTKTTSLAVTATSGNVALGAAGSPTSIGAGFNTLMVSNTGSSVAFLTLGTSSAVAAVAPNGATAGDYAILPGTKEPIDLGLNTFAAAICASGQTTTLYFTPGVGS